MKKIIVCLVLLYSGCGLFESQYVIMDPAQVEEIQNNIGNLTHKNMEEWIKAAEALTDSDVEEIRKVGNEIILKLSPPAQEAGIAAGTTLLNGISKDPTPAGVLIGLPAAILAFVSILAKRNAMKEKKNA